MNTSKGNILDLFSSKLTPEETQVMAKRLEELARPLVENMTQEEKSEFAARLMEMGKPRSN